MRKPGFSGLSDLNAELHILLGQEFENNHSKEDDSHQAAHADNAHNQIEEVVARLLVHMFTRVGHPNISVHRFASFED